MICASKSLSNHWLSADTGSLQTFVLLATPTLTLMLLAANLANTKLYKEPAKMTETLAYGYSSDRFQQELSNEYENERVLMFFKNRVH